MSFYDHFIHSGWFYADSNNEHPIFDGSRCYIACPNGSYIQVEHFYGEYDDAHPECFQSYKNGIFVLLGLWNTKGPDVALPDDDDVLEKLRIDGINLLYENNSDWNNESLKYPLKLTSGTWRNYESLPASKYDRWDQGTADDPMKTLSDIYYSLSDCYRKQCLGDSKYEKCKSCYCRFLGLPGDCRNLDFDKRLKDLRDQQNEYEEYSSRRKYSRDSEVEVHELELSPYYNPDWLLDWGLHEYKQLFASPIPGVDAKTEKEHDIAEYMNIECPSCHEMTPDGNFCSCCGTKLRGKTHLTTITPVRCKHCGQEVSSGKFCTACGCKLDSK